MRFPFLETSALEDLQWTLASLPLWWLAGLEQLIWLPVGVLACAKQIGSGRTTYITSLAGTALLLVCAQLLSAAFIVESYRSITLVRNLFAYVTIATWLLALTNAVRHLDDASSVIKSLVIGMTGAALLGTAGIIGLWRPSFTSPLGLVLPSSLLETTFGTQFVGRSTGALSWFIGLGEYFRVESVFLFATFYSIALVATVPAITFLIYRATSKTSRALWMVSLITVLLNLVYTTGRVATIALIVGAVYFIAVRSRLLVGLMAIALAMIGFGIATSESAQTQIRTLTQASAYARGSGSVQGRGAVYSATLEGIRERPVFGWGTERDVVGLKYPAGSHSNYLGTLYRLGIVGFLCLTAFLASAWIGTSSRRMVGTELFLVQSSRWALISLLIIGITDSLDLDVAALIVAWTSVGVGYALARRTNHAPGEIAL